MLRVFLDANVLFSAAYAPGSGLRALWKFPELVTSMHAAEEARRNLDDAAQRRRLDGLLTRMTVAPCELGDDPARDHHGLPAKDRPILWAAIDLRATHLLTGDRTHFGHLFGRTIEGVKILTPRAFLDEQGGK